MYTSNEYVTIFLMSETLVEDLSLEFHKRYRTTVTYENGNRRYYAAKITQKEFAAFVIFSGLPFKKVEPNFFNATCYQLDIRKVENGLFPLSVFMKEFDNWATTNNIDVNQGDWV